MPADCQALIDGIEEQGKGKTVDEICSILNMLFNLAIKHSILTHNPMELVFHKQHETQHGKALTKEEGRFHRIIVNGRGYISHKIKETGFAPWAARTIDKRSRPLGFRQK